MKTMCVNALSGLISFLLNLRAFWHGSDKKGVNALSGLISFLLDETNYNYMDAPTECQCPKRADFISTYSGKP